MVGRVAVAIAQWNPSKSAAAKEAIDLFFSNSHAREAGAGLTNVQLLLNVAKNELQMEAEGLINRVTPMNQKVFIGHGRSAVWLQLKVFLNDRSNMLCDEFNAEAVAGLSTTARLQQMLDNAWFAFLVMTAEDMHTDSTSHARENVIHEAGLFQGRLGFERAIILLEEGCTQFSNIHGLTHIPFPKGNLEPAFEKIRHVLERETARSVIRAIQAPIATGSQASDDFLGVQYPKCSRQGWYIESSTPDEIFGACGGNRRVYKCKLCGFSEKQIRELMACRSGDNYGGKAKRYS